MNLLRPLNPRNPRTITDERVEALRAALIKWGDLGGIVHNVRTNRLVGGHQRIKAFQSDETAKVEVTERLAEPDAQGTVAHGWVHANGTRYAYREVDWDEPMETAAMIAANKYSGEWEWEGLTKLLRELDSGGFEDLALTGFTETELADLLQAGNAQPLDVAAPRFGNANELQKKWGTETGQVWALGEHRLMCGDSTDREAVARLMAGERAGVCFTSPPYGQQRDYKGKISDWDKLMQGVCQQIDWLMEDDGQLLINLGIIYRDNEWVPYWSQWLEWMNTQGWRRFGWYVWDQGWGMPGDGCGRFGSSHEFIFHFNLTKRKPIKVVAKKAGSIIKKHSTGGFERLPDGSMKKMDRPDLSAQPTKIPDSVIRVNRQSGGHGLDHPAIFPIGLPALIISAWPGLAYEPFSGSGTTLLACEQLGRACRAMELSPAYVAVALERFHEATGKTPTILC